MNNKLQLPTRLREIVDRELEPHEVIQWIEQPIPEFFTPASIGSVLFGIPWTAFSLFWIWGATGFGTLLTAGITPFLLFPLFGVPFVLVGFGMLSAPFWTRKMALQTVYLVTDRRAISIEGGKPLTIRSYLPSQLNAVYRQENPDGSGNVLITIRYCKDSDGDERKESIGFMRIRNPKQVEKLLRELSDSNV
jgi:hypothetical protein